jgi:hypothetical protein
VGRRMRGGKFSRERERDCRALSTPFFHRPESRLYLEFHMQGSIGTQTECSVSAARLRPAPHDTDLKSIHGDIWGPNERTW